MKLQGRSPGKRAAGQAARRQAAAAAAGDRPASASAGGFWPTISGAESDALLRPDYDMDAAGYAARVSSPLCCMRPSPHPAHADWAHGPGLFGNNVNGSAQNVREELGSKLSGH